MSFGIDKEKKPMSATLRDLDTIIVTQDRLLIDAGRPVPLPEEPRPDRTGSEFGAMMLRDLDMKEISVPGLRFLEPQVMPLPQEPRPSATPKDLRPSATLMDLQEIPLEATTTELGPIPNEPKQK
jgi:hypothetical protein